MGLMKWMMKRGALGGIARTTAKAYLKAKTDMPRAPREELYTFCIQTRYMMTQPGLIPMHIATMKAEVGTDGYGLLGLCEQFARSEMDIVDIEEDVRIVLREVLVSECGLSAEDI